MLSLEARFPLKHPDTFHWGDGCRKRIKQEEGGEKAKISYGFDYNKSPGVKY